jgi:hypothetical protein
MSAQTTLTEFDGVLVTIRSERSFFEVTKSLEASLQRLSVPRLMEHVARGDREGLEAYVDLVSAPSKFSIFWEMDQGPAMRLAGIPIESKFYLCVSAYRSATVKKRASTSIRSPPFSASFRRPGLQRSPSCWTQRWSRSSKTPPLPRSPTID